VYGPCLADRTLVIADRRGIFYATLQYLQSRYNRAAGTVTGGDRPVVLDRRDTERGELVLRQAGEHFEVIANGTFLMDTRDGRSERALVREAVAGLHGARMLLAGLGVGVSLDEALRRHVSEVVVVELEPVVVEWARGPLSGIAGHGLDDPRVRLVVADLRDVVAREEGPFDAVCLDVDNGPGWLVHDANAALYSSEGLAAMAALLRAGGRLAVWAAAADPAFEHRLAAAVGPVAAVSIPVARGADDVVYVARKRAA
jgi:spermidine synthase